MSGYIPFPCLTSSLVEYSLPIPESIQSPNPVLNEIGRLELGIRFRRLSTIPNPSISSIGDRGSLALLPIAC
ncbi:hypothetical protein Lser_V15G10647 [Lactuca serriola]